VRRHDTISISENEAMRTENIAIGFSIKTHSEESKNGEMCLCMMFFSFTLSSPTYLTEKFSHCYHFCFLKFWMALFSPCQRP